MAHKQRQSFSPKSFLAMIGEGRSIANYSKDQTVFLQGDPADAVFYIQKGKIKVTVVCFDHLISQVVGGVFVPQSIIGKPVVTNASPPTSAPDLHRCSILNMRRRRNLVAVFSRP